MQLGFVSAILPDNSLEEVFQIGSKIGYDCVEVMCWPKGKSERRYAGVTHIDVHDYNSDSKLMILELCERYKIAISGLGYYPNPLVGDRTEGQVYIDQIKRIIEVAADLGIPVVNTFIGRDHTLSVDDNWPRFLEVWRDIVAHADRYDIKIGIENCPMIFTADEWPGGKNLGTTPAIWDKMYSDIPNPNFGLNYDPSHMIWQHMDFLLPIREYSDRFHHVHAKDVRLDQDDLDRYGIMAHPNLWHTPKLPGKGDVNWEEFFAELRKVGYDGAVCVEVEDRDYEGSLEKRIEALQFSHEYLKKFIPMDL